MNRKQLQTLVEKSYEKGLLNTENVGIIASNLTRRDLKQYLAALKAEEKKHEVLITSAYELNSKEKQQFSDLFPDKQLLFLVDKQLIAGIKVQTGDLEYEVSITNSLNNLSNFLNATYDR